MITFDDDFSEDIAYIVENDLLLTAVGKELKQLPNVSVVYDAKIKEYVLPVEDDCKVILEDGTTYDTNLLVSFFNQMLLFYSFSDEKFI